MNRSSQALTGIGLLAASLSLVSCSASSTSPLGVKTEIPTSGVLKLGVGTANIYGDMPMAAMTGTNVAVTFRQPAGGTLPGGTAALVNTPTLSGPWKLPTAAGKANAFGATILTGPSASDVGTGTANATAQQNPGTPNSKIPPSTFGVATGATGLGLEPLNYTASGGSASTGSGGNNFGAPASYVPYAVPIFDAVAGGDPNQNIPWGGPPAYDPDKNGKGTRDSSGFDASLLGEEEGLDVFQGAQTAAGPYTLSVNVPTSQTSTGTVTATASVQTTALLPAIAFAGTPAADGAGGATFAVTLPPGVTEALVQIIDLGPAQADATGKIATNFVGCNGSMNTPTYYTLFANASGNYTLGDNSGAGLPGSKVPSLCTQAQNAAATATAVSKGAPAAVGTPDGDQFTVQLYGFDYPAYEASYPQSSGNPNPTIVGNNGQSDITISSATLFDQLPTTGASIIRVSRSTFATTRGKSLAH